MTRTNTKSKRIISSYTIRRNFSGQRTARDVVAALVTVHQ